MSKALTTRGFEHRAAVELQVGEEARLVLLRRAHNSFHPTPRVALQHQHLSHFHVVVCLESLDKR